MNCKFCNAENADNAVYCKVCGKRIDGKKACPSCKQFVDEDAVYCNYCGKRLDGKKVCPTCGIAHEGKFCPTCGSSAATAATDEIVVPSARNWKGILNYIGTSFALLGVAIALIFVFLIGFNATNSGFGNGVSDLVNVNVNENVSIYDYFGKNYEQIAEALDGYKNTNPEIRYDFLTPSLYIPTILCTVIAAGALIAVTTLSALAIVGLARKLAGKQSKNAEKLAYAAFLTYALSAILLKAFNETTINGKYTSSSFGINIKIAMSYNGATVAGLVIGAIAMGICLACFIAVKGAELKQPLTTTGIILTVATAAIVAIVANYASCASHTVVHNEDYVKVSMTLPASSWLQAWGGHLNWHDKMWDSEFFLITFTMFMQVAVVSIAMATIICSISKALANKNGSGAVLGLSIALMAVSIVYLVVGVIATKEPLELWEGEDVKFRVTPMIVTLVFAAVNLGVTIANSVIAAKRTASVNA